MKKHFWAIFYSLALTAFSVYAILDTFVISDVYQNDTTQINMSVFDNINSTEKENYNETEINSPETSSEKTAEIFNETSNEPTYYQDNKTYQDSNIKISLSEYYQYNTKIYVADVQLSSAKYLKTAFANNSYGKNITEKTSSIAQRNNAILAINGDYYGTQETGYVIRNGIIYRDTAKSNTDILCMYANGSVKIFDGYKKTAEELVSEGVWQAFSFGPGLTENGSISVSKNDEVGKAMASNPRTAIGIIDNLHYVFVVSDGRTNESQGLSLYQLAEFMNGLGVSTSYNLDGGGSSTMYFQGEIINNPTTSGRNIKERAVSDIVYIGK